MRSDEPCATEVWRDCFIRKASHSVTIHEVMGCIASVLHFLYMKSPSAPSIVVGIEIIAVPQIHMSSIRTQISTGVVIETPHFRRSLYLQRQFCCPSYVCAHP